MENNKVREKPEKVSFGRRINPSLGAETKKMRRGKKREERGGRGKRKKGRGEPRLPEKKDRGGSQKHDMAPSTTKRSFVQGRR